MKKSKPEIKPSKESLPFIVSTMIHSCVSMIDSIMDDVKMKSIDKAESNNLIRIALESLGWNLSILYAQLTGDGMGVCDALEICDLFEKVERFGKTFYNKGVEEKIDHLAKKWHDKVFGDYNP